MNTYKTKFSIEDFRNRIFGKKLFLFALILLAIAMPLSPFLTGASQFLLLLNFFAEKGLKDKWREIRKNKALQFFLLIFGIHLLGLTYTQNFSYAFHDLKIKLPLLVLPILIVSSYNIKKHINTLLFVFVIGVVLATFISFLVYLELGSIQINNFREISIFISHIRFSLMIILSACFLFYYLQKTDLKNWQQFVTVLFILWLLFFLIVLQALTGWIIAFIISYLLFFLNFRKISKTLKIPLLLFMISLPVFLFIWVHSINNKYFYEKEIDFSSLPTHTKQGKVYIHDTVSKTTENGYFTRLYYCPQELEKYWQKYSKINIDSKDQKGQDIRFTLIRYLTSKNLPKDAEGLSKLDKKDIDLIEKGYANCIYRSTFIPFIKMYELLWEINNYKETNNKNGKSILMRTEFLKIAWEIFKENKTFGLGTGDVRDAFKDFYKKQGTKLLPEYQLYTHNQYLTFLLAFGIIGFIFIAYSFIKSVQLSKNHLSHLSLCFLSIFLLSMLVEDTLETQAGVTFVAYFYSILILRKTEKNNKPLNGNGSKNEG